MVMGNKGLKEVIVVMIRDSVGLFRIGISTQSRILFLSYATVCHVFLSSNWSFTIVVFFLKI